MLSTQFPLCKYLAIVASFLERLPTHHWERLSQAIEDTWQREGQVVLMSFADRVTFAELVVNRTTNRLAQHPIVFGTARVGVLELSGATVNANESRSAGHVAPHVLEPGDLVIAFPDDCLNRHQVMEFQDAGIDVWQLMSSRRDSGDVNAQESLRIPVQDPTLLGIAVFLLLNWVIDDVIARLTGEGRYRKPLLRVFPH